MEKDYLKDISEIKNLMNRSTQFISLSGLSGVMAGIYALIGAFIASRMLDTTTVSDYETLRNIPLEVNNLEIMQNLIILAFVVLLLSITTCIILSFSRARKLNETFWNSTSRRLLINFSIPLIVGGLFSLILLAKGYYELIAPLTLVFYGLACVQASKYTFRDVRYLGIIISGLGIISSLFMEHSLLLWAIGFGVMHIIYGLVMHIKYERNA